ncbi:MAG: glycosyltransferase family A protein [Candidatus Babeliales bacterium]|nr:glycosyltransferase family A protein [Candidatus Babeliales bacterium]
MIQKIILILLILLTACSKHPSSPRLRRTGKNVYKFSNIDNNKKFVIVIPSYNNEAWYKYNLDSVFAQKYNNFRVIYIDDNSTDKTYDFVKKYLKENRKEARTILIKNKINKGALANHYKAILLSQDDEIIVSLDGDDWFANDKVLEYLNNIYKDPNIWMTYGQFQNWPTNKIGWCKPVPKEIIETNKFREFGFCMAQPRTYYAWLAKKIKNADLCDENNNFYKIAGDVALMFPMIEMAGERFKFIPDVLCIRNVNNILNDFKVNKEVQKQITREIRAKEKYTRLSHDVKIEVT